MYARRQEAKVLQNVLVGAFATFIKYLTIGSDCKMACWNRESAEGTARRALIMFAPELWPATVILEAEPPKLGTTFCRNERAVITSATARLCAPEGARKPS